MGFIQYLKDTRGELRHVAWPTRFQTVVYTILVILLSILVALYLGLFDYLFTTGLRNALDVAPAQSVSVKTEVVPAGETTTIGTSTDSTPSTGSGQAGSRQAATTTYSF